MKDCPENSSPAPTSQDRPSNQLRSPRSPRTASTFCRCLDPLTHRGWLSSIPLRPDLPVRLFEFDSPENGNNCQCQSPRPPDLSRGSHPLPSPMDAGVPNHRFATEYCRDCCKALASSKLEEDDVLPICHRLGPTRVSRAVHPGFRGGFRRS
ncbi:conserved hypothetical protein [Trichinella spiralis]|uniref:hypothetical protein n=1 Tax=Trichinella spiralis TaxID=6334 RepID=UPI0001EFE06C|nr:conserved hypothetical protein [Trichinella spiralis]XP_003367226.1 conserved hypothetical protein [Trichinella spiralis]